MDISSQFLLTLGGIFLLGLVTSTLTHRIFLPRVTILLLFGVLIGKDVLDVIPTYFTDAFDIIADMTLLMVGFLLGGRLTKDSLDHSEGKIVWISLCAALAAAFFVGSGLIVIGVSTEMAIILGCIAAATAPAAVLDVVIESKVNNKFTRLLLAIVSIDDVWALVMFSVGIAFVIAMNGQVSDTNFLLIAIRELGGAIILGVVLGVPATIFTGRIKKGQPILTEALGLVFICGGLAMWLEVSHLIAAMTMGAVIANNAKHHDYPFHAIEGIEWPFMVIFFVLAGASLELSNLKNIGVLGLAYCVLRIGGKLIGASLGSRISHADRVTKTWMGSALLPQAGVAIGMALVASAQFPEHRQLLLSIVISTTVFFEIIGPVFARFAIQKSNQEADTNSKAELDAKK